MAHNFAAAGGDHDAGSCETARAHSGRRTRCGPRPRPPTPGSRQSQARTSSRAAGRALFSPVRRRSMLTTAAPARSTRCHAGEFTIAPVTQPRLRAPLPVRPLTSHCCHRPQPRLRAPFPAPRPLTSQCCHRIALPLRRAQARHGAGHPRPERSRPRSVPLRLVFSPASSQLQLTQAAREEGSYRFANRNENLSCVLFGITLGPLLVVLFFK